MIRISRMIPTKYLLFGSRPAVIMEKTSHGLVPVSFPYTPVMQEEKLKTARIIVADPLYRPICPETAIFYEMPHIAFSGRIYLRKYFQE